MSRNFFIALMLLPGIAAADQLPGYVLLLPESVKTVLVAETDTATLHRYDVNKTTLQSGDTWRMSIGQNGVGKMRSGDRRTPLGIYFVLEQLDTTNMHEKYGPVAFPLDYPNAWDFANARTGHGIWIHGVAPGSEPRPKRDTDGCIALPNDELLALDPHLTPLQTPVIVTRHMPLVDTSNVDATREQLLLALSVWTSSYRHGDWYRFLSLYEESFSYRGMDRDGWSAYRVQTVADRTIDDFTVDEIMLIADPETEGLYLSRFRQRISESGRTIVTTKRLYWRRSSQGEFKIIAEDNS